jgi:hypothetical protein
MNSTFEVLRNGRVVVLNYCDPFTVESMGNLTRAAAETVLVKATQPVYFIADFTNVTQLPSNILTGSVNLMRGAHPMTAAVIVVANNAFVLMMAESVSRLFSKVIDFNRMSIVRSRAAALTAVDNMLKAEMCAPAI